METSSTENGINEGLSEGNFDCNLVPSRAFKCSAPRTRTRMISAATASSVSAPRRAPTAAPWPASWRPADPSRHWSPPYCRRTFCRSLTTRNAPKTTLIRLRTSRNGGGHADYDPFSSSSIGSVSIIFVSHSTIVDRYCSLYSGTWDGMKRSAVRTRVPFF